MAKAEAASAKIIVKPPLFVPSNRGTGFVCAPRILLVSSSFILNSELSKPIIVPDSPDLVRVPCDCCGSPPPDPFLAKFGGFYTECSQCGFIFSNPRASDPGIYNRSNNEDKSGDYIQKHYSKRQQKEFTARLRQFARYRKTNRILEVGCSAGGFLCKAREMGWAPVGIEPVEMVARHGIEAHALDVRICTLEEAQLEPGSFDVIYSNAVLEHLPSPRAALQRMRELLRPGGVILAVTVNYESYTRKFVGAEWKLIDPRAHLSLFSPSTLRALGEKAGLNVLKIRTTGVRFRAEGRGKLKGVRRWAEEIRKTPYSIATRLTKWGDSIEVWARKPSSE